MSCAVNVSGTWKYAKQAHVNVNGTWKPCQNIYVNVSGAWKPLYTYSYETGSWGACSADCGGGTQTRTVTCRRRDATNASLDVQTVADSFCAAHGLTKPAASQSCNTQACEECRFEVKNYSPQQGWCDNAPVGVYAWEIDYSIWDSTTTFFSVIIYWNSTRVTSLSDENVTDAQINGYLYTKSVSQGGCRNTTIIPPGNNMGSSWSFFTVCRRAV